MADYYIYVLKEKSGKRKLWYLEDTSLLNFSNSLLVFCSVSFTCRETLAVKTTTWKSERAIPLGLWLIVSLETHSPPTTLLWLVTSCGLSLSQMHQLAEQDSEPPSHTVSVCVWKYFTSLLSINNTVIAVKAVVISLPGNISSVLNNIWGLYWGIYITTSHSI